jgi:hypothetical protein
MAAELVDRMAILVAIRRFFGIGVAYSRSLRYEVMSVYNISFVELLLSPFGVFGGGEFMQRLSNGLHGTLGPYLRDALHEGSADRCCGMPSCFSGLYFFLFSCLVVSAAFL